MKSIKKIPVSIPLENNGSISDVIQDFINTMENVTNGNVELDCDLEGNITIYYEQESHKPIKNERPYINMDVLYRGEYVKSIFDRERKRKSE